VADDLSWPVVGPNVGSSKASKTGGVKMAFRSPQALAAAGSTPSDRIITGVTVVGPTVDYTSLAAEHSNCPECKDAASSPSLKIRTFQMDGTPLLCDTSSEAARPLVPAVRHLPVFLVMHSLKTDDLQPIPPVQDGGRCCPMVQGLSGLLQGKDNFSCDLRCPSHPDTQA
jgi:hypothetical protein